MLEMYSPGCHGCKAFMPVYDEWAQSDEVRRNSKGLLVAKVNGGENDCPMDDCEWNTYPSVYFFKAGSTGPPLNVGARDVAGLTAFAQAHASFDWDVGQSREL